MRERNSCNGNFYAPIVPNELKVMAETKERSRTFSQCGLFVTETFHVPRY